MEVKFENFTISEGLKGRLTVTAKNGFTIRLSVADSATRGIHINGPQPGADMEVWSCRNKVVFHGKKTLVTVYEIKPKVKA